MWRKRRKKINKKNIINAHFISINKKILKKVKVNHNKSESEQNKIKKKEKKDRRKEINKESVITDEGMFIVIVIVVYHY